MEPKRQTPAHLLPIQKELEAREPIFHRPDFARTRADLECMTAEDFWEVGASGKAYSREFVIDLVENRMAAPQEEHLEASDFYCQQLAEHLYLLTYILMQENNRKTRRSTIWRRTPEGWSIVYHQGTIVQQG